MPTHTASITKGTKPTKESVPDVILTACRSAKKIYQRQTELEWPGWAGQWDRGRRRRKNDQSKSYQTRKYLSTDVTVLVLLLVLVIIVV